MNTERTLIENCLKGDKKSQYLLVKQYSSMMMSICRRYARDQSMAKDILQEALILVFKHLDKFEHKGSFEGWMKRIVINTALQTYRQKNVLNLVEENYPDEVEVDIDENEISLDFLLNIIQELPERYRLVFNLYVLDGYSHKEISDLLHIAEGTSKSNLSRARLILKDKVEFSQQQKNAGLF